jgi:hypothetical protein
MKETINMTRDQLISDYGEIIDNQREEIARLKTQKEKMFKEFREIEQMLGKALNYPWFKDDQENFPGTTEADGVVIDGPTWGVAMHAAVEINELKERVQKLSKRHPTKEEALAQYHFIKERSQRNK